VSDGVRIDKWLWAVRFYKTRSLAAQAVSGGKVHLNGVRVKPARAVKVADTLEIHKEGVKFCIAVLALSEREALHEQYRLAAAATPRPEHKPDKKARRQLRNLKW